MKSAGNLLWEWRVGRGMTARDLARATGFSAAFLVDVEGGHRPLTAPAIERLAAALHLTADEIERLRSAAGGEA